MDNDRLGNLLMHIGEGDRDALRALYIEGGPKIAAHLGASGVPAQAAGDAIVASFAKLWSGDYTLPVQYGDLLIDWLVEFARSEATTAVPNVQPPVATDDTLWARVTDAAYPESPRNILRRLDVLFALGAAFVWAILLLIVTRG